MIQCFGSSPQNLGVLNQVCLNRETLQTVLDFGTLLLDLGTLLQGKVDFHYKTPGIRLMSSCLATENQTIKLSAKLLRDWNSIVSVATKDRFFLCIIRALQYISDQVALVPPSEI